jgi:hypothetical protein
MRSEYWKIHRKPIFVYPALNVDELLACLLQVAQSEKGRSQNPLAEKNRQSGCRSEIYRRFTASEAMGSRYTRHVEAELNINRAFESIKDRT